MTRQNKTKQNKTGMINLVTKALVVFGLAHVASSSKPSFQSGHLIKFQKAVIDTSSPEKRAENWPGDLVLPEKVQILVHFVDFTSNSVETLKEICGTNTHDFIPENTAIVTCYSSEINKVKLLSDVDYVGPFAGEFKIPENWKSSFISKTKEGKFLFKILIANGFSESEEQTRALLKSLEEEIKGLEVISTFSKYATVAVPEDASSIFINFASNKEYCSWIQPIQKIAKTNREGRWITQTAVANNYGINDLGIDGTGITIGITDSGIDTKHCFFYDPNSPTVSVCSPSKKSASQCLSPSNHRKVVAYYALADGSDDLSEPHGTHVCGTAAGNPVVSQTNADHKGLAYNSKIALVDIFTPTSGVNFDLDQDVFPFLKTMGSNMSSNSWGYQNPVNVYDSESYEIDNFAYNNPEFLILFAAGNDGPSAQTIDPHSNAKNGISVGSVVKLPTVSIASYSSRGPTKDSRIKPDIVAPGSSIVSSRYTSTGSTCGSATVSFDGTSMATPNVAGAAALVYQYYRDGHICGKLDSCKLRNPTAALVKATLINSGQHFPGGNSFSGSGASVIGFGRVKLDDTLSFAKEKTLQYFDRITIGLNEVFVQKVVAVTGKSIKVTLVWADPASTATATANRALLNDLDLRVISPSGKVESGNKYLGFYTGEGDGLNNVEQVLIPSTETEQGEYTVHVVAYALSQGTTQTFALVINNGSSTVCSACTPLCKGKFSCGDSKTPTCIDYSLACDGKNDCPNQTDEDPKLCNILNKKLTDCRNGIQIATGKNCDGIKDCPDGGDELECSASTIHLTFLTFASLLLFFLVS